MKQAPTSAPISVRQSTIHGRGVYASRPIRKGEQIIEYKGEHIDWDEAMRRHPHDPSQPNHTFYFTLDDTYVIDGRVKGNAARWINHSCAPNCRADLVEEDDGRLRVFIEAIRSIRAGEELCYDYGLVVEARHTQKLKREFACWCGARRCRGTMLAPKRKSAA
jgi:uncharacterized protein